jgi:RNase P subunit RPR2
MKSAYSIAPPKRLYKNTVMLQNFNTRIICPYCRIPLAVADLEEATLHGRPCLICPECATVLISQTEEVVTTVNPEPALHD